jgi:hypothetical protein
MRIRRQLNEVVVKESKPLPTSNSDESGNLFPAESISATPVARVGGRTASKGED